MQINNNLRNKKFLEKCLFTVKPFSKAAFEDEPAMIETWCPLKVYIKIIKHNLHFLYTKLWEYQIYVQQKLLYIIAFV